MKNIPFHRESIVCLRFQSNLAISVLRQFQQKLVFKLIKLGPRTENPLGHFQVRNKVDMIKKYFGPNPFFPQKRPWSLLCWAEHIQWVVQLKQPANDLSISPPHTSSWHWAALPSRSPSCSPVPRGSGPFSAWPCGLWAGSASGWPRSCRRRSRPPQRLLLRLVAPP